MMYQQRVPILMLAVVGMLCCASPAAAQFSLIDNFDTYTLGSAINGQGGWTATGGAAGQVQVVADPADALNQAIRFSPTSDSTPTYHSINIPNTNTAATIFFRARRDGAVNFSWGTSDLAAPTTDFNSFETQFNMQEGTGSNLTVRDAGAFDLVGSLDANQWYDLWMVIDNSTNTYQVYMDDGTGVEQLMAGAQTDFAFRNGPASNALTNLFLMPGSGHNANFYIDDIYLDLNGENLTNPTIAAAAVPEPSSIAIWALASIAGLVAIWRRKRPASL